jgi:N-acetyl-1-D-myo-inositol-2-amino-2-deoxy-alpha-D-glucopyranoside deacetylase
MPPTDHATDPAAPALVAVHAHPDDEAIATGGLLARAAGAGWDVTVVTCTGGELGEPARPTGPGELAEVRRAELAASLATLGANPPVWLGYRDSGMRGDPGNDDPASFWRAPFDEAVGRLVAVLCARRPALVVTYDAYGLYGHPDHVQAHRVTLCAVEAAAHPRLHPEAGPAWRTAALDLATIPRQAIAAGNAALAERGIASPFGTETDPARLDVGTPDEEIDLTVDVRAHLATKRAALGCHESQLAADSLFVNVPSELAEALLGTEWFVRARAPGRPRVADPADPLADLPAHADAARAPR